ncbi:Rv2231c family pyridoxal phosphate-dependent protein CobC [Nocardioides montaniterrae]
MPDPLTNPLGHHGDVEVGDGLLDFAVNVFVGPRPDWLDAALRRAIDDVAAYPDPSEAAAAIAIAHGRAIDAVLPTAGAAEAFTLIARMRAWRRPAVVHPQFTEPHAALLAAGHEVTVVETRADFTLDPDAVPDDADLVVVGNPTNPTGIVHPAAQIRRLTRPGRVVVVDEAFMDTIPDEGESLSVDGEPGLVVLRSLTKHWSIPGIRAGYVVGDAEVVAELGRQQTPWSVSTQAIAAITACLSRQALAESRDRAMLIDEWRLHLEAGLTRLGVEHVPSRTSFVLARVGRGVHEALRERGIAVRRADTFPGLDASWVRIAVRPEDLTDKLLLALDECR